MKPFTSFLLLFLILSGCTSKPTESIGFVSQTATLQPTVTKTPTPDATPTPTRIHLRIPTLTQRPILPATRIPPTVPIATLNAKATLEPLEDLCDEFETDSSRSSEMSPNGEWFAINCGYKRNQKLIVLNLKGTKWVFDFAALLRPKIEGMPGTFESLVWSSDGRFLYFSKGLGYSGGGNQCFPGFGVYGLYRLHLQSGTLVTLVPSRDDGFPGDEIDFSPTNDYYAIDLDGVRITNLTSGKVTSIHVSGVMEMSWSPDGRFLAFSIANCGEEFVESSSIYVWDSSTNQSRVLFSSDMLLTPKSWINNSTLEFEGEKWVDINYLYTIFEYDLAGNKMNFSATATPRP